MISLCGIEKTYQSGDTSVHALRNVSLDIFPGDLVAIVGSSGSGKSTLMNILGLLDTQDSGSYLFEGREISAFSADGLSELRRKRIGFVFQSFNLLPRLSAHENVEIPLIYDGAAAGERRKRASEVLESVGLSDRENHMPSQLSGGQQQRVAIARALCKNPAMILADEPTGNLDSKNTDEIMNLLKQVNASGTTIVMITHEKEVADCCRRVVTMKDGTIL
ncbi:MAG: ATP-binding cassette domain-containing protein [Candidatus Mycalebacterium zealandia]|nr:MAG: ATP-binding cassette domain-containing protein [Candidatus Mycalebacterium zealandia]